MWLALGLAIGGMVRADGRRAPVLDRVRRSAVVRCGGVAGPGLAAPDADGAWHGLMVDVCRAVAVAVLGRDGRVAYRPYRGDADFAGTGDDDIVFLTAGDLIGQRLLGRLLPGPAVYYRTIGLAVARTSPIGQARDLDGGTICFEPGSLADRAVDGYFAAHGLTFHPMPFQETEEMLDAFADRRCTAMAGEVTGLALLGAAAGDRILPEVLGATAVLAASSLDDGGWAAVVGWTVATLLRAEADGGQVAAGPLPLLPITVPTLGLGPGWQGRVVDEVGDYAAIYQRNLGAGSSLGLPRGASALVGAGGWLVPPGSE